MYNVVEFKNSRYARAIAIGMHTLAQAQQFIADVDPACRRDLRIEKTA